LKYFPSSTGYLQDHARHTSVLGVANRDTGEATAPRSSSSRQQNDSEEINYKAEGAGLAPLTIFLFPLISFPDSAGLSLPNTLLVICIRRQII
jgi:hypothetical protein